MHSTLIAVSLLVVACGTTPTPVPCQCLVARASKITEYPVSRDRLVRDLGLIGTNNERNSSDLSDRRGDGYFNEFWTLPDGCTVRAMDEDPKLTKKGPDVDRMLRGYVKDPALDRPRHSFRRVIITDRDNRTVYDSAYNQ